MAGIELTKQSGSCGTPDGLIPTLDDTMPDDERLTRALQQVYEPEACQNSVCSSPVNFRMCFVQVNFQ